MNTVLLSACTQRNSHFSPLTPVLTVYKTEAVLLHTAKRQLGVWKLNLLWTTSLLLSYPPLMDLPLFNGPVSICLRVHVSINSIVPCFIYKNSTKQLVGLISLIKLLLSTMNNIIVHIPLYACSASDHLSTPLLLHQTSIPAGRVEQWCTHGTM